MSLQQFHPAVQAWFSKTFQFTTAVQNQAWDSIVQSRHTLLSAPTGSGKTLAAFLAAIDKLVKEGLDHHLPDQTRVVYISPLKALSNDIQINLQQPIQGIQAELLTLGLSDVEIKAWVRTGDTPQSERNKAARNPPHILVTTPESIYILLTSASGRNLLRTVETVIVDEIHAIAGSKRGSHLSLSLERLQALIEQANPQGKLQRIGLSATQKPIETMAHFLMGNRDDTCDIIDLGYTRQRDLALEIPDSPLTALMSNEVWNEIYDKLESFTQQHRTLLIFVNTRRLAERVARFVAERIGDEKVMAHHGSMSKEKRLLAEQKLKQGHLKCLVATASLELGIDIGDVDLVCQLGSPRSIAVFLQRVGRSGHKVGAIPKGRIFPLTRDELVEATALLKAANENQLDRVIIPMQPMDVLAQQIVAEVSAQEWSVDDLYSSFKRAWPYRELSPAEFENIIKMLAEGYSTHRGRRGAYIHYDAVNRRLRPRKNARLLALTNGGAIPDQFDCDVILLPENIRIGTIGEDFAFESIPGDIFQLGNNAYRTLKTETGKVFVEDAKGQPPNIPFWFGEAPGRSDELSQFVSELRQAVDENLEKGVDVISWLQQNYQLSQAAATQLHQYLATAKAALGQLPTQKHIVFERFFDEVGDMHFVIHSSYGSRVNKAWGLALRKRFCRKFNFELQASALEDSIVLSLSSTHSFAMQEVSKYLHSETVQQVLIQALLDVPMFPMRWRWNATISLAVLRNRFGKRSPPYFQRSDAEDLVAMLFPDQIACGENIAGDRIVPDHPLVQQTINDCLHETMDVIGLINLLQRMEMGKVLLSCCELTAPSPLSEEIINARPYAFLDDGEAEQRRTMAIKSQRYLQADEAASLRQLNSNAIEKVREQAWPKVTTEDELHDALMVVGFLTEVEVQTGNKNDVLDFGWLGLAKNLATVGRATLLTVNNRKKCWVAAETLHEFKSLFPNIVCCPDIKAIYQHNDKINNSETALITIIRRRLQCLGPVTITQLTDPLALDEREVERALLALEQEGYAVRVFFNSAQTESQEKELQWCERRLLALIHRYTRKQLRNEIELLSIAEFMRFLFAWQGISEKGEGVEALAFTLQQLEGYAIPAEMWHKVILPARIQGYSSNLLESLTLSGRISWLRLNVQFSSDRLKNAPVRSTPISLIQRTNTTHWCRLSSQANHCEQKLSACAKKIQNLLVQKGALFFMDMVLQTGLLKTQVEDALGELVNCGLLTSDSYVGLKALCTPASKRPRISARRKRSAMGSLFDNAGRWSLINQEQTSRETDEEDLLFIAKVLLQRYGVVFKKILQRESCLPPWRDLLSVYWRMEARGEIRGGRFVEGVSGEQFAMPEAMGLLSKIKTNAKTGELVTLASADPLNFMGILLPGKKVAVSTQATIVFRDGCAIALQQKNDIEYLCDIDEATRTSVVMELVKKQKVLAQNIHKRT